MVNYKRVKIYSLSYILLIRNGVISNSVPFDKIGLYMVSVGNQYRAYALYDEYKPYVFPKGCLGIVGWCPQRLLDKLCDI